MHGWELYNDGTHVCVAFYDLVDDCAGLDPPRSSANQFLIVDDGHGCLAGPWRQHDAFAGLLMGMQAPCHRASSTHILDPSHADPTSSPRSTSGW